MAKDYNVTWTPNLLLLDADGKVHQQVIGFLPSVDFIANLLLGIGKAHFDLNQFEQAIAVFDRVLSEYSYTN